MKRPLSSILAAILVSLGVPAVVVATSSGPAGAGQITITSGAAAGVPAGDYLLTVNGLKASTTTLGEIAQRLAGSGAQLRNADLSASPTAQTVSAQVRVSGPSDVFTVITRSGTPSWSSITLTPATWGLVSRGTRITSPTSTNAIWHGVNIPAVHAGDYAGMFSSYPHTGAVRTMIDEGCWDAYFTAAQQSTKCNAWNQNGLTGSQAYQAEIQNVVNDITSTGRVAVLTVNNAGRDDATWMPATESDDFGPDQQSLAVYQQLASLFGSNPLVVFETNNEPKMLPQNKYGPQSIPGPALWLTGGVNSISGITWNEPGVQQVVDQIRSAGANNLIMVEALSWGENLLSVETAPVLGTNLGYSFHGYVSPDNSATYPSTWDWMIKPVISPTGAYAYASLLTEFGTAQVDRAPPLVARGSQYLQSCITWAVKAGLGWLAHIWYPQSWDQYGLLNSLNPLSPSSRGQTVVRNY